MNNTRRITVFIGAMASAAIVTAGFAVVMSHAWHGYLALAVLALAAITSRLKVKLPGINGNMSVNLPFLLIAVVALGPLEAVAVTCVSAVVQCWPRQNAKLNRQQTTFNLSMMVFASTLASLILHSGWQHGTALDSNTLRVVLATATLFLGQTAPVAGIVAISEGKAVGSTWWNLAQLSFPYYVVSAGVTSMVQAMSSHLGWGLALAVFPVMYGIHRSYRLYFGRIAESISPPVLAQAARAGA